MPTNEDNAPPLIEGVDYYVENGLWVFTAEYLRDRGYCCRSGCRHCPYGFVPPHAAGASPDRDDRTPEG